MKYVIILLIGLQLFACSASKQAQKEDSIPTTTIEERHLDTMVVSAPKVDTVYIEKEAAEPEVPNVLPTYQGTYERSVDLLHTTLHVSFDWDREAVKGLAEIEFTPYFYATNTLELDAKKFEIHKIYRKSTKQELTYSYDDEILQIDLGEMLSRGQKATVVIDYTAFPGETGGSAAITSDKGLFFINPDGSEEKPQQIWTQGETEHNSKWFPTVDKPNERMTSDLYITVQDKFKTLSNGLLIESKAVKDGLRQDHWRMDQPHAPYLFMVAVGEFAVVKDQWKDIPLAYWVEPEYEKDAKAIYANTPEMLTYFSELLDVEFPWKKYDQIVVRDYVSGAMENTTAVIFGEFVQRRERDLIDNNNDRIVAHELFHHWFGDLVTTESWANLTLNEGFANYSEHLWRDYKYGKYEGQAQLFEEKQGYLFSTNSEIHPLIDFHYINDEDMFDAHSYNKGGAVLHMLRHQIGDDAFFKGLKHYLTQHQYSAVEVHDLRLAFEKVSGLDLNWFFNQWYLGAGHPILDIQYSYVADRQELLVTVSQTQDPADHVAIFQLPAVFELYNAAGETQRYDFWIDQRVQSFVIPNVVEKPAVVNFDPDHILLTVVNQNYTEAEATFLVNHTDHVADIMLNARHSNRAEVDVLRLLNHPSKDLKLMALELVTVDSPQPWKDLVQTLALNDPHSFVQAAAISRLNDLEMPLPEVKLMALIQSNTIAYRVVDAALKALHQLNPDQAMEVLQTINIEESASLIASAGNILSYTPDKKNIAFFEKNAAKISGESALDYYGGYIRLLSGFSFEEVESEWQKVIDRAADSGDLYTKYGVIKGMADAHAESDSLGVTKTKLMSFVDAIVATVDNPQYKAFFKSLIK